MRTKFYFQGTRPTPAGSSRDLSEAVDQYVFDLHRVARGEQIALHLSDICDGIARRARQHDRISREERDRLLAALEAAFATAAGPLAKMIGAGLAGIGERTMRALVARWAQDDADRAARLPGEMVDLASQARVFQNAVHNVSLVEEIAARARHRTDAFCREIGR